MFIDVRDVYWGFRGYESSFWRTSYPPRSRAAMDNNPLWKNDLRNDRSLTSEGGQVVEGARRRTSVQKVKLEHLEEEIIGLWHYVYALRLQLKDD